MPHLLLHSHLRPGSPRRVRRRGGMVEEDARPAHPAGRRHLQHLHPRLQCEGRRGWRREVVAEDPRARIRSGRRELQHRRRFLREVRGLATRRDVVQLHGEGRCGAQRGDLQLHDQRLRQGRGARLCGAVVPQNDLGRNHAQRAQLRCHRQRLRQVFESTRRCGRRAVDRPRRGGRCHLRRRHLQQRRGRVRQGRRRRESRSDLQPREGQGLQAAHHVLLCAGSCLRPPRRLARCRECRGGDGRGRHREKRILYLRAARRLRPRETAEVGTCGALLPRGAQGRPQCQRPRARRIGAFCGPPPCRGSHAGALQRPADAAAGPTPLRAAAKPCRRQRAAAAAAAATAAVLGPAGVSGVQRRRRWGGAAAGRFCDRLL
mmetsp:Transcript_82070/g.208563  ORF Transcript_82070/g.208563 Transcript_82070/m.208563 type:complete len:375 (+) Transcript_82070:303-1427(+)